MKEWFRNDIHKVNHFLRDDQDFQELFKEIQTAEAVYQATVDKLTPEDRWAIENYIALCEEIERKRTMAAYYCRK